MSGLSMRRINNWLDEISCDQLIEATANRSAPTFHQLSRSSLTGVTAAPVKDDKNESTEVESVSSNINDCESCDGHIANSPLPGDDFFHHLVSENEEMLFQAAVAVYIHDSAVSLKRECIANGLPTAIRKDVMAVRIVNHNIGQTREKHQSMKEVSEQYLELTHDKIEAGNKKLTFAKLGEILIKRGKIQGASKERAVARLTKLDMKPVEANVKARHDAYIKPIQDAHFDKARVTLDELRELPSLRRRMDVIFRKKLCSTEREQQVALADFLVELEVNEYWNKQRWMKEYEDRGQ